MRSQIYPKGGVSYTAGPARTVGRVHSTSSASEFRREVKSESYQESQREKKERLREMHRKAEKVPEKDWIRPQQSKNPVLPPDPKQPPPILEKALSASKKDYARTQLIALNSDSNKYERQIAILELSGLFDEENRGRPCKCATYRGLIHY